MEASAAILAHFDMNGDGRISFEEFVNGMRRMGGSAREGGGLLSASPAAAAAASFPNGTKEHPSAQDGYSGEQGGADGNATGKDETAAAALGVADANGRGGEENASPAVATGAATIDQEGSHRPSEPAPLRLPEPSARDVRPGHHAAEAPDNAPHEALLVRDDSKTSRDDSGGGAAAAAGSRQAAEEGRGDRSVLPGRAGGWTDAEHAAAARLTSQVVADDSRKQGVVGSGSRVAMPKVAEGGPRLERQACGCVLS